MANSNSGDSIVNRVVRLLSAFDRHQPSMSLSALARRAGLPLSTTHRLVEQLIEHRLIENTPGGELRIGMRLWELGARGSLALPLQEVAIPFMEDVQSAVHHITSLAIIDHNEMLYVIRLAPPDAELDAAHIAQRFPLHAASSGLVLLAYSSSAFQDEILAGSLEKVTEETVIDPVQIRRRLAEIRYRGYAAVPGIAVRDWTGIAVPILGAENTIVAALNATVPRDRANVPSTLPALMTAARGISRGLGAQIRPPDARRI